MKKLIEFKKQRELGEVLTDTFGFIRQEFKPFFKTVLQICGPYLLLFLIALAFYIYSSGDVFNFQLGNELRQDNLPLMFGSLFAFMIFGVIAYTVADSTVLHYIKLYVQNEGSINIDEVKQNVKDTFWGFLGLSILKLITLFVAVLICCLPVFYVMVPMYVVFCIYVFENKDATTAYSYSFSLIKSEFWITFATIIVIGIIAMIASYALDIPASIYSILKMGVFSGEIDPANMKDFIDPVYILLNVLSYLFKFLLNLILTVSAALIYFNLNERQNFTGTFERIQSLGKTED
ncbi:hypothetical protein ACFS5M_11635 [Lacinutrix iliipiscaria]|uniref:Glycerophosphoryl diester phosphodiesterase membrane domain-containing protein n=1 Tax=Lacinutrix iliipiscaria TaxID=1230532 RepID=A0ABW5WNJ4_9FLAO